MANVLGNNALSDTDMAQHLFRAEEPASGAAEQAMGSDLPDQEQEIVTACYLCHGQCGNFGVHGKGVRPCARGMSQIINRRREARLHARSEQPQSR